MATFRAAGPLRLMCASLLTLPYLLFVLTLYPAAATAQIIDCYYFNGTVAPNNTKCPGSNTCCGPKVACFSNRLCADPDPKAKLVRGPCAVKGWDDSCPQICMYSKNTSLRNSPSQRIQANHDALYALQTSKSDSREWAPARTAASAATTTPTAARAAKGSSSTRMGIRCRPG